MVPKKFNRQELDLFTNLLESFIDLRHPLCRVGKDLDWNLIEEELGQCYSDDEGRPGKAIRLIVRPCPEIKI